MNRFPTRGAAALCAGLATFGVHDMNATNGSEGDPRVVRGMTISCQTWGWEWGRDEFEDELADLTTLGVNWVSIHPYATIRADGGVQRRFENEGGGEARAPRWIMNPIECAVRQDVSILIKPHLAYWGSPFAWRGEIAFDDPEARAKFWREYSEWIVDLARMTSGADGFCVGTELDRMLVDEDEWRELIRRVRAVTSAQLVYAANWDRFEAVGFWDALDAIGVQAYFPLTDSEAPRAEELRAGWRTILAKLEPAHRRTGKPVVFTEFGYSPSPVAASRPWEDARRAQELKPELQALCLRVGLEVIGAETAWLRGAFLWNWFVGEPHRSEHNFYLDKPLLRGVIRSAWRPADD